MALKPPNGCGDNSDGVKLALKLPSACGDISDGVLGPPPRAREKLLPVALVVLGDESAAGTNSSNATLSSKKKKNSDNFNLDLSTTNPDFQA